MKKLLAFAMSLLMVFGMCSVVAFAADADTQIEGIVSGKGNEVTVTVSLLKTKVGIGAFALDLAFNPAKVAVKSTEDEVFNSIKVGLANLEVNLNYNSQNKVRVIAADGRKVQENPATIFTVVFTVLEGQTVSKSDFTLTHDGVLDTNAQPIASVSITLVESPADVAALNAAITKAEAINEADYTAESFAKVTAALATAKGLTSATATQQLAVDAAVAALEAAIKELVVTPVKALKDEIKSKEELSIKAEGYTPETFAAYTAALEAAKAVIAKVGATDAEYTAAMKVLDDAFKALVALNPADYVALKAAIAEAEALNPDNYSTSTYIKLAEAVKAGKLLLNVSGDKQAEIDAATKAITDAIAGLAKVTPNTSDYSIAVFSVLAIMSLVAVGFIVAKKKLA